MDFELVEKTETAFHPRAKAGKAGHAETAPRGQREARGPRQFGGKRRGKT
jgi:hypothetical protein